MNLFINKSDYQGLIRADIFDIIINYDDQIRLNLEPQIIEEAAGYLRGRYGNDIDCLLYNVSNYDSNKLYNQFNHVWHNGLMYFCLQNNTSTPPPPTYLATQNYIIGDTICYNYAMYECVNPTTGQFNLIDWSQIPSVWVQKDRRNPTLLLNIIKLMLFHIHSRLAQRQIPQQFIDMYEQAMDWLNNVATGRVVIDTDCPANYIFPNPQTNTPNSGATIAWGSESKRTNRY